MFRFVALLALALLALPAAGQGVIRAEPHFQPPSTAPADPSPARHAAPERVFRVELGAPSLEEVAARLSRARKDGSPLQIGFARDVAALRDSAAFRRALSWETLPSGARVAALSITSPEAAALRIPVAVDSLPAGAILRFYGAADDPVFEVPGAQVLETIQRNLASGDRTPEARAFYSPVIEGATATLEVELPAAVADDTLRLAVGAISHLVTSARLGFVLPKAFGDADTCEVDVMCHAEWTVESNAVARMIFSEHGHSYYCTGTLLANLQPGSTTPYFLTANHCISTPTVASTLQTRWLYRHPTCAGGAEPAGVTLTGGATWLYSTEDTDTSFLRLNNPAPAGTAFAGWIAGPVPPTGTDITGIHHPSGDVQKISFGDISDYVICTPKGQGFGCVPSSAGAATFYQVVWREGVTEGGSSGSAIWDDAGQYVRGQLYGGSSYCSSPTAPDYYGRFDVAFNASLKKWLAPPLLVSVASRKFHAGASSFDLPIVSSVPVTGDVSVEPRVAGTAGHQIVFAFDTTVSSTGTAVSTGVDGLPLGTASPMAGANEVTVSLSGIPATTRVKVTLTGVNGSGASYSASVGLLVGDDDSSRAVDSLDVDGVKGYSGLTVDAGNFRHDLNLSGAMTAADILVAKGRVGLAI